MYNIRMKSNSTADLSLKYILFSDYRIEGGGSNHPSNGLASDCWDYLY